MRAMTRISHLTVENILKTIGDSEGRLTAMTLFEHGIYDTIT